MSPVASQVDAYAAVLRYFEPGQLPLRLVTDDDVGRVSVRLCRACAALVPETHLDAHAEWHEDRAQLGRRG